MTIGKRTGIITIRTAKEIVNIIVTVAVLFMLVFGSFSLWDSRQVRVAAASANYTQFRPTEDNLLSFQELQAINSEVFAWLTVFGTNIDYPVVQGDEEDNIKYVNTNVFLEHSPSGAIFMDWKNSRDFSDFKSIFFGHHMAGDVMFGEIGNFHDFDYFNARRYGTLYFDGQTHGLEFFSFLHTHAYDDMAFNVSVFDYSAKQQHIDYLLDLSIHVREGVSVTVEDRLLLLSTCSDASTNGRDILIAKIVNEIFENPFETETPDRILPQVGELGDIWSQLTIEMRIILAILPLLLIVMVSVLIYKKTKKIVAKERN